jgi:4-nitrophenol 2-monooxygenase / 4-nitrocatechol 4-monooxygenase, reductase component
MDTASATELDREQFREVIGHFMSGVTVITATDGERDYGMTASAVTSLSLEPPMMLVCLNNHSTTQAAITRSRAFAISVLAEGQHDLIELGRIPDNGFVSVAEPLAALRALASPPSTGEQPALRVA